MRGSWTLILSARPSRTLGTVGLSCGCTGRGREGVRGEGTVGHAHGEGTALLLTAHGLPSGGRRWVWPSRMCPSLPQGLRDPVCLGVNLTQNIDFSTRSQVPASGRQMLRSKFQGILPHPADPGCFPASPPWQPGPLIKLRQQDAFWYMV